MTLQLYANEKNIFVGIFSNLLFIYIALGEIVAQMAISTFGGAVFRVTGGLTAKQWLICWGLALGHVPWHVVIVNIIPVSMFDCFMGSTVDSDIEAQDTSSSVRLSNSYQQLVSAGDGERTFQLTGCVSRGCHTTIGTRRSKDGSKGF